MAEHQSGGGDVLLVGGIAVAAYLLWPSISAAFSSTPATVAPAGSTPAPVTGTAATGAAAIAENALLAAQAQQTLPTPSSPQGTLVPLQSGGPFSPSTTPPVANTLVPLGPAGQPIMPRAIAPIVSRLKGSAAQIAQAALNQVLAEGGPQITNHGRPIDQSAPGAIGTPGGCWTYGNTPVLVNCPPGAVPPTPRPPANGSCMPGYTMDAAGICARAADQVMLAQLNSTTYTGPASLPAPGQNISPAIIDRYTATIGVIPSSVLAQLLGLPANPSTGVIEQGNDGFGYMPVSGVYMRQGTATQATRPTGPIGPRLAPLPAGTRLQGLGWVAGTLPIGNATLIAASNDPDIAQLVGNDPRAMLTLAQWNYYFSQATGIAQGAPPYPAIEPHMLISAQQYQAWRQTAGLPSGKLGIIRNSRPGMFPLGGIGNGSIRRPFIQPGNTNIFRIPGRGAVRLGLIENGGGDHRWARSPFPRPADWRMAQ